MPRTANQFEDPAGNKATYDWPVNHSEEEEFGRDRNIETGAPTSGIGLVQQQGADSTLALRIAGTIFHKEQVEEMWEWFQLSRSQSIYFHDFAGDSYEVIITSFKPTRHRTLRNPRDFANAPYHFWRYTMEMRILRVIDGPLSDAGVTP